MKGNNMKNSTLLLAVALGVSAWSATAQEAGGPPPDGDRPPHQLGQPSGPGGPGGPGGIRLLPPGAPEQLNLTTEQLKQLEALEAETKVKIEKILTPEQLKQMQQMRPPQREGDRPGRQGAPGSDQSSPDGASRPQRPAME